MYRYLPVRGHITRLHGGNCPEDGLKNLVESRLVIIMWNKPTCVLYLLPRIWENLPIS